MRRCKSGKEWKGQGEKECDEIRDKIENRATGDRKESNLWRRRESLNRRTERAKPKKKENNSNFLIEIEWLVNFQDHWLIL